MDLRFQSVFIINRLPFVATKVGYDCCKLHFKAPKENKEEIQVAIVSLAAAEGILSELGGNLHIKEEKGTLKVFLDVQHVFALLLTGF